MPESEPKPKLIELAGPGAGQGWKAVLKNGKPTLVHEIPVPPAEAQAAVPRLQRLFDHRHPALSPVLAWGTDNNGVWVAVEPNEGTPLSTILQRGPLTPPAAAALGAAVLSGVAALHEAGIAMGGFGATAVRVTTNGDVRIAGHPSAAVRAAPSQSDLRADVRSCGMAVCAAFGVDPAGAPAPPNISPGLVVTMRSMASGAMGPSADRAMGALREMASVLLSPDREMAAQSELATRAGGREVPAITPFLPPGTVPPVPGPSVPQAPAASAPAPYLAPPPRREETPVRQSVSYEAPDRPVQTYPSLPAVSFPPPPAGPPAAPAASTPAAPAVEPKPPTSPPVPTWAEAPAPPPPTEPAAPAKPLPWEPAASVTPPPAPAYVEAPAPPPPPPETPKVEEPPPVVEPPRVAEPPKVAEPPRALPTWDTVPQEPAAAAAASSVSPFSTSPPSPFSTSPPANSTNPPAPAAPPTTPAPAPASPATWSPVEQPVWKPGEGVPAEPLGAGYAVVEAPPKTPTTPPIVRGPISAPAPRPAPRPVPRPSRGGGGLSERPPWLVPGAVAVVIVLLLAVLGAIVLANRSSSPTGQRPPATSHPSGTPTARPTSTPTTGGGPRTVPTFAPASVDPVKSVQICTTASPCNIPGSSPETGSACDLSSCKLEVAIYFTAVQKSTQVSYIIRFFNRCTGDTVDLTSAGTTTPPSGFIVAIPNDHLAVAIPSGVKSGALVAISQQPAVAASAPLLLGASTC